MTQNTTQFMLQNMPQFMPQNTTQIVRVGSRESALAVAQAEIVMAAIAASQPEIELQLVTIRTTGDKNLDADLESLGGKGVFITELEAALMAGSIDIAIHSYKDMPYEENSALPIVALSAREAAYDVLVLPDGKNELDNSLPVGSSSQRRSIQFQMLRPDVEVKPVRGNVLTRLAKLDLGEYSALILAQAGLKRLELDERISQIFTTAEMVPSGSQGIIAVQGRAGENYAYLSAFHSTTSEIVSLAERQFLRSLGSSCSSPVGVFAELKGDVLEIIGMYVSDSGKVEIGRLSGDAAESKQLGEALAKELLERGGAK